MQLYCRALAGAPVEVSDTTALVQKNIGWVHEDTASPDGTTIFLPPSVDRYPDPQDNFAWFKVVATHQVAHLEFGTFAFSFDTPSTVFTDRRVPREQEVIHRSDGQDPPEGRRPLQAYTAIGRFLRLFINPRLAFDIFTVLEDCRLDYRIKLEYPGIRSAVSRVQAEARASRPRVEVMPVQEALVELLIHMSLEHFTALPVPTVYADVAVMLSRIVHALRTVRATVEDTAEATLRAYAMLARLPNAPNPEDQWQRTDLEEPGDFSEAAYEALMEALRARQGIAGARGTEQAYDAPAPVDFRGDFQPHMVQLLTQLQLDRNHPGEGQPLSQKMLEPLWQESVELTRAIEPDDLTQGLPIFVPHVMQAAGFPPPATNPGQGPRPLLHHDDPGVALAPPEPGTYAYAEWDFCAAAYKPHWCIVKEKALEEGDPTCYHEALQTYNALLNRIKHQFERIMPESYRKIYRLIDGEDVDLNAALEAFADLRMHVPPDDKLYWRRQKVQRDVAVVFLLDMSASTAEPLEADPPIAADRDAPPDRAGYRDWLRRRATLTRPTAKRIIDVEKESIVLLIQALESIGDTYGIYGFSGYGRDNVEFYVIKDLAERFGERIKRRIDTISPRHATRMGAAVRHAITKLEQQPATTKLLLLLSDGRPQDRGYSRPGAEQAYAVHDTHRALLEAKAKGITPFCLTVDKAGHDYLQVMCGDIGYEVLDEISSLPARLPMLYRALTR
ncbi:MAG: VWA domain-containing protein [Nitrospinae bacterium]|nr:VWA domain-containing protein [Nitrospinota bacterium]